MRTSGREFSKLQFYLRWFIVTTAAVSYSHGAANFVRTPDRKIYVIKGEIAKFVWTYQVHGEKATVFNMFSPVWFYKKSKEQCIIGRDNGAAQWQFQAVNSSCSAWLFIPSVRVSRADQATLVIKDVIQADSGVYGCTLDCRSVNDHTDSTELIVTESPRFTKQPPEKIIVIERRNLNISCSAVGPPAPNVTWVNVTSGHNLTQFNGGTGYLHIANIHRDQNGKKFKCLARNNPNQGAIASNITTVIVYYPPEFTLLPVNTTVTQGDVIFLHCQAKTSNPVASILWARESKVPLTPGHGILRNGTLIVPNAARTDTDKYICTAQNHYQSQKHNRTTHAFVTVKYGPSIIYNTSRHLVKVGQSVEMRCKAEGYPKPTIKWEKSSGSIELHGEWYNISSVSKSDAGTYTCTASNNIGEDVKADIHLIVQYKPVIDTSASNTTGSSWDGNTMTLRCKYSEANPKPTWIWTKPNGENISSTAIKNDWSEKRIQTGQDSSDYGTYKCIAENDAGSDHHEINVTQLRSPGQVNFTIINIEAASATVIWSKPVYDGGSPVTGYKLEVGKLKFKNISESEYTTTVTGLTKDTEYTVKLYAKNVVGYGKASNETFRTKKQGPPASPVITRYNSGPSSVSLSWSKPDENGGEITSYTIYKKTLSIDSGWKQVGQIYGSPLTYTVKNLQPGTTYQFIVTATNRFGESVIDDGKAKSVKIPVVTTTASETLAPIDGSKDKRSEPSDPNQPIIIAGAVVAVVLVLVTVIISVIILKKRNIFGKAKRKSARTENAAYHNDVHSDDSSGRQAAAIDLGDASATYAAVDTSKKTKNKPKEIATYAAVDKSKKKKKPGEIIYAELADFNTNYTPAENRPVKYLETDYADISQFQNQSEPEPTYANFPGRSKDYANVSDI